MIPQNHEEKFLTKSMELFHLLLDTSEEIENEVFRKKVSKCLIIIGNFVFFLLCLLIITWVTTVLVSMLPEFVRRVIKNIFTDYGNWQLIFLLGFYTSLVVLFVTTVLLRVRKYIMIYKLAKFYTYIEIAYLLLGSDKKPIYMSMLEAIKKTLF